MAASFTADRRLFWTGDKRRIVEEGDPSALLLAYNPGDVVPAEEARKYDRPPKAGAAAPEAPAPEPEAPKQAPPAEGKPKAAVTLHDGKGEDKAAP